MDLVYVGQCGDGVSFRDTARPTNHHIPCFTKFWCSTWVTQDQEAQVFVWSSWSWESATVAPWKIWRFQIRLGRHFYGISVSLQHTMSFQCCVQPGWVGRALSRTTISLVVLSRLCPNQLWGLCEWQPELPYFAGYFRRRRCWFEKNTKASFEKRTPLEINRWGRLASLRWGDAERMGWVVQMVFLREVWWRCQRHTQRAHFAFASVLQMEASRRRWIFSCQSQNRDPRISRSSPSSFSSWCTCVESHWLDVYFAMGMQLESGYMERWLQVSLFAGQTRRGETSKDLYESSSRRRGPWSRSGMVSKSWSAVSTTCSSIRSSQRSQTMVSACSWYHDSTTLGAALTWSLHFPLQECQRRSGGSCRHSCRWHSSLRSGCKGLEWGWEKFFLG